MDAALLKIKSGKFDIKKSKDTIYDQMTGQSLTYGVHWSAVDQVLFPMFTGNDHWVAGRFIFKERTLYIYNSYRKRQYKNHARTKAEKYAEVIPFYLEEFGIFKKRKDILSLEAYKNARKSHPLQVELVEDIPEQTGTNQMAPKRKQTKQATPKATKKQLKRDTKPKSRNEEDEVFVFSQEVKITSGTRVSSNQDVIDFLKQKLPETVIQRMEDSVFGKFIKHNNMKASKSLLHYLLLRELKQEDNDYMVISLGGHRLTFGFEHFLLISGLRATPINGYYLQKTNESKSLLDKYFKGHNDNIKRPELESVLKNEGRVPIDSDDDFFTIGMVYFIHSYIMGHEPHTGRVPTEYFDAVVSGEYSNAAWGYLSFQETINGLKSIGRKKKMPQTYVITGFPMVFQAWFYEACGACEGNICERITYEEGQFMERFFQWKSIDKVFKKTTLDKVIFNVGEKFLKIKTITPTKEELEKMEDLIPFPEALQKKPASVQGSNLAETVMNMMQKMEDLNKRVTEIELILAENNLKRKETEQHEEEENSEEDDESDESDESGEEDDKEDDEKDDPVNESWDSGNEEEEEHASGEDGQDKNESESNQGGSGGTDDDKGGDTIQDDQNEDEAETHVSLNIPEEMIEDQTEVAQETNETEILSFQTQEQKTEETNEEGRTPAENTMTVELSTSQTGTEIAKDSVATTQQINKQVQKPAVTKMFRR